MRTLALLFSLLAFTSAYGAESRYKKPVKPTVDRPVKLVGHIDNTLIIKVGDRYVIVNGDKR